jgi:hypothetical protein
VKIGIYELQMELETSDGNAKSKEVTIHIDSRYMMMRKKRDGKERATSLRSERPERAPWKCRPVESVENSPNEFPTLSTGLGNPAQNAGFPHFHRAGGGAH